MKQLLSEIHEWQKKTFTEANPVSKLHHLSKEVVELVDALKNMGTVYSEEEVKMEYADCFFLLFGSAMAYGMDLYEIERVMRKKLEINKKRKWGKPDENGVVLHEKE